MKNFFIKTSDDKKTIKMNEENHTATISLFGIKILIGYNKEEGKSFSFGFNKTKLINKTKKVFNNIMNLFQRNKDSEADNDKIIEEIKEEIKYEIQEPDEKELDDKELVVKSDNYIGTVKVFGLGIIISYNRKYKNFINFKQDKVKYAYSEIKEIRKAKEIKQVTE